MQGFLLSISIAVLHNPCFLHLPWKQKNNERLKHPLDSDNKKNLNTFTQQHCIKCDLQNKLWFTK